MTGSWKGRGNQYIQLVKVLYCKLPTNGKQLPAFPLEVGPWNRTPISEVGGKSVTTLPSWQDVSTNWKSPQSHPTKYRVDQTTSEHNQKYHKEMCDPGI